MSQYPSPYSTPQQYPPGYDPFAAYLAPARRAGLLMIILGVLLAGYSLLNVVQAVTMTEERFLSQIQITGESQPFSFQTMRVAGIVLALALAVAGLTMILLGVPVRRGRTGAIIGGLVITGILTAVLALFTLLGAIGGLVAPVMFVIACVLAVPLVLFVLQVVWLVQALRAGSQIRAMQMQWQQQYWQYQQQQQMYGQGGVSPQQSPPSPRPEDSHGDTTTR